MSRTPTVSIVTPSFNQGAFLEDTIRSVAEQTYPSIEHIVIDGGSTDDSVRVLERHASRLAYWESAPDEGFAHAIAKGFERSSGEILSYLNSDDMLAPTAVAHAVSFLGENPDVVMVYGNRMCIDARGRLLYVRPTLPIGAATPFAYIVLAQESCFWRRSAYDRVGGIDRGLRFAIDYDLFSRFAKIGRIAHCGRIWAYFRKHADSKTMSSYATLGRAEVARIQREQWGTEPSPVDRFVHAASRSYAVVVGGVLELGALPREVPLPPRARLHDRLANALPEEHWIRRASRRLGALW